MQRWFIKDESGVLYRMDNHSDAVVETRMPHIVVNPRAMKFGYLYANGNAWTVFFTVYDGGKQTKKLYRFENKGVTTPPITVEEFRKNYSLE